MELKLVTWSKNFREAGDSYKEMQFHFQLQNIVLQIHTLPPLIFGPYYFRPLFIFGSFYLRPPSKIFFSFLFTAIEGFWKNFGPFNFRSPKKARLFGPSYFRPPQAEIKGRRKLKGVRWVKVQVQPLLPIAMFEFPTTTTYRFDLYPLGFEDGLVHVEMLGDPLKRQN